MFLTPDNVLDRLRGRLPYLAGVLQPATRLNQLGLDSLDLVELVMAVDELFGVRLTVEDFKQERTVGELAELLATRAELEVPQP